MALLVVSAEQTERTSDGMLLWRCNRTAEGLKMHQYVQKTKRQWEKAVDKKEYEYLKKNR